MDDQSAHDEAGTMSVQDMQKWLQDQIRDSAKAHELRIKEATGLVTEYAQAKLTTEQMEQRMLQYDLRWGEALPGASAAPGMSDENILRTMDRSRDEHNALLRGTRRTPFSR